MGKSKGQKQLIWFIFIFTTIILLVNFFFLQFWYAKRNPGYQDGFHIHNTQYSVMYWSMKISYLSTMFVVAWSGFEVASMYDEKYKPSFTFTYLAVFWISWTMIGESVRLPFSIINKVSTMWDVIINTGNWWGSNGFVFTLIDLIQFTSIHSTIPILVMIYALVYSDWTLKDGDEKKLFIWMNVVIVSWIAWCLFWTALGEMAPYPIIDSTPNDGKLNKNGFSLAIQVPLWIACTLGINALIYIFIHHTLGEEQKRETI